MPQFMLIDTATLGPTGTSPNVTGTEWINLDQITYMRSLLTNDLGPGAQDAGMTPTRYYPLVELNLSDGTRHRVPLGAFTDSSTALDAIDMFIPTLAGTPTTADIDEELRRLLGP